MSKNFFLLTVALAMSFIRESSPSIFDTNFDYASPLEDFKISSHHLKSSLGGYLRKISMEKKMRISFFAEPATFKIKLLERVIPCDELPDFLDEERLDCQPSANESNASNSSSKTNAEHLKRTEVRFKFEHEFHDADREANIMIHFYPMRKAEVASEIDASLEETNINCLNHSEPHSFRSGYYIDGIYNSSKLITPVICRGKFLAAINSTKDVTDTTPLDLSELNWLDQGFNNGFLLSLPELRCHMGSEFFSINMDFTIIKSLQFPYLALRHNVRTSPISQLLTYRAELFQEEHDSDMESQNPDSYDTTIHITSKSFMPFLNFDLLQTFTNLNATTGYEKMMMTIHELGAVAVFANWTEKSYNKSVNLYSFSEDSKAPKLNGRGVNHTNNLLHFHYDNKEEDDHIFFTFGIKKDWFGSEGNNSDKQEADKKTHNHLPRIEL